MNAEQIKAARLAMGMHEPAADRIAELEAEIARLINPPAPSDGTMREHVVKVMYDAWPHKVISKALADVTGMPMGETLTWDVAKAAGADFTGLYRYADAAITVLTNPAGEGGVREIVDYLRSLSAAARAHHAEVCLHEDEDVLSTIVTRMETYAFAADQIENGVHRS